MKRFHCIALAALLSNSIFASADVAVFLDSLKRYGNDQTVQEHVFHEFLYITKPADIKLIKQSINNDTYTNNNKIDLAIILYKLDRENRNHWAKYLLRLLPKSRDEYGALLDIEERMFYILGTLTDHYLYTNDKTAIDRILLYWSFSDGCVSELFGPMYHKILLKKPVTFLNCVYQNHKHEMDDVLSNAIIESEQDTIIIKDAILILLERKLLDKKTAKEKLYFIRHYKQ